MPHPFGRFGEILDLDNGLGPHFAEFEIAPNFGFGEVFNSMEPAGLQATLTQDGMMHIH